MAPAAWVEPPALRATARPWTLTMGEPLDPPELDVAADTYSVLKSLRRSAKDRGGAAGRDH